MKRLLFAIFLAAALAAPSFGQQFVAAGDATDIKFTTRNTTPIPATLSGSPVIKAYKGNSTSTETTTGLTLTVDFDSHTGLNNLHIDTSADSSFYSVGADISFVITTGTVGGNTVESETVGAIHVGNAPPFRRGIAHPNYHIWMLTSANAGATGKTVTCQIQKDAGSFANSSNSVSEVADGEYRLDITATEMTAADVSLECTATGALTFRTNIWPQQ